MSTFEDFLVECLELGHTQVKLVPQYDEDGSVQFYAVGQCGPTSGGTFYGRAVDGDFINPDSLAYDKEEEYDPEEVFSEVAVEAPAPAPFVDPAAEPGKLSIAEEVAEMELDARQLAAESAPKSPLDIAESVADPKEPEG